MNMPKPMAMGKSMMRKPMLNSTPTQKATMPCPRKYLFMPCSTSATTCVAMGRSRSGSISTQPLENCS